MFAIRSQGARRIASFALRRSTSCLREHDIPQLSLPALSSFRLCSSKIAMAAEHFTKANNTKGEFVRVASTFRDKVTADGSSGFPAEAGRYHLYISLACPWASRCFLATKLKGLTKAIGISVVHYYLDQDGWAFRPGEHRCDADPINGKERLREIYLMSEPGFSGRVTVPVLFDKKTNKIVNNESAEILRMLSSEFNSFCETDAQRELDFYPERLRAQIDEWNDFVYP